MILRTLTGALTMGSQGRDILQSPVTAAYHPAERKSACAVLPVGSGSAHSTAAGYVTCTNNVTCIALSCAFCNVLGLHLHSEFIHIFIALRIMYSAIH